MGLNKIICILFIQLLFFFSVSVGQNARKKEIKSLQSIVANPQKYVKQIVTMTLKLKSFKLPKYDPWVIIFYDTLNHDIIFFIEPLQDKKRLKKNTLNLHRGVLYTVTFKVKKTFDSRILADLISFSPYYLKKIL